MEEIERVDVNSIGIEGIEKEIIKD